MNFRSLVERVVRDSQEEFARLLEDKLIKVLASELVAERAPVTASGGDRKSRETPSKTPAVRAKPVRTAAPAKAARSTSKAAAPARRHQRSVSAAVTIGEAVVGRAPETSISVEAALVPRVVEPEVHVPVPSVEEVDLPVLRALARTAPIVIVGGAGDDGVLAALTTATGLSLRWVNFHPDDQDQSRPWDDGLAGLIVIDAGPSLPAVNQLVALARRHGHPVARARDAGQTALLSALIELEEAAAGTPVDVA